MPRIAFVVLLTACAAALSAQTPQPFPRPGTARPAEPGPATSAPAPRQAAPPQPAAPVAPAQATTTLADGAVAPTQATLGLPVYPAAQFLASYDAGRGQRYYIFGTTAPFAEIVTYYRTQLNGKGDLVFREPPTHMFEVGRFREETMAFPPGVTVKDWSWGGSQGYLNPKPGAQPARFPTIIMLVPAPAGAPAAR